MDSEAFDYTDKYITKDLIVPVGCASIYSSTDVWKDFWEIRESGSNLQQKQCASADGYINSETSTATLCWLESAPTTEGTNIQVLSSSPILFKTTPSVIIVDGATVDNIDFYNIYGNILRRKSCNC